MRNLVLLAVVGLALSFTITGMNIASAEGYSNSREIGSNRIDGSATQRDRQEMSDIQRGFENLRRQHGGNQQR